MIHLLNMSKKIIQLGRKPIGVPKGVRQALGKISAVKLADFMLKARKEKGWTQGELAERTGLGLATVRRMERGSWDSKLSSLDALANVFGVQAAEMLR